MLKFSRIVGFCILSFLLISPFAFSAGEKEQGDGQIETGKWDTALGDYKGETLMVIMIADPWVDAFEKVNAEFERITGAKVIIDAYGYDATHEKEVLEGAQKSGAFDVIVLDSPWVGEFWEGGFVEDLTPYIKKEDPELIQYDDFVKVFREVVKWDDRIVGMPFGAYFVNNYYRADLFEKEGIEPPKTFEEVIEIADLFTDNPKYPNMYGTVFNNQQGSPVGQAYFEYIWNFGGKPFKSCYPGSKDPYADMTPMFDSPESIEVVKYFKEMLKYQPPGSLSMAWDERAQAFASGRVAMVSAWSVRTPIFQDPNRSSVTETFKTAVIPAKQGQDPVPPVGGWAMGISSYSKKKNMAWDYIKWFTSPEIHKKFVLSGGPPSRNSTFDDPELNAMYEWLPIVAESADMAFADCRPRVPESFEIISTVGLYVSRAMTGEMSPESAMKAANKDIRELLKKRGYYMSE